MVNKSFMSRLSTFRQEEFAKAVAQGQSYSQAARTAGYSRRSCGTLGSELAREPRIAARIRELEVAAANNIPSESILAHLGSCESTKAITVRDAVGRALGVFVPLAA